MSEEINHHRRRLICTAAITIAATRLGMTQAQQTRPVPATLPVEGNFPSLGGATTWLNSQPLTADALRGKVVLINFCTYTCINWLRSLPYVRAWAGKYKNQGLVAIGAHTPEFSFEKDLDNVRRALKDMRIEYPIAIDNDHAIWRAFNNEYWPALYFIDAQGHIRHHKFGEGDYDQSERVIQQLLTEAGVTGFARELVSVDARSVEAPADWRNLKSPENYVGYARTENFASPGGERWSRLIGHEFEFVKWSFADVGLSTAPLAAPCAGQERAVRWVTRPVIYAACSSVGRLAK